MSTERAATAKLTVPSVLAVEVPRLPSLSLDHSMDKSSTLTSHLRQSPSKTMKFPLTTVLPDSGATIWQEGALFGGPTLMVVVSISRLFSAIRNANVMRCSPSDK